MEIFKIIALVALGSALDRWSRRVYPWTQNPSVRYMAFTLTVGLASLAADIDTDLTLPIELSSMVLLVSLGVFSSDPPAVFDYLLGRYNVLLARFNSLLALFRGLFVRFGGLLIRCLLAPVRGLVALFRGLVALFSGLFVQFGGLPALFRCLLAPVRGLIALFRGMVALYRDLVALFGGLFVQFGGLPALFRCLLAPVRGLIALFRGMVALFRCLVALFGALLALFIGRPARFSRLIILSSDLLVLFFSDKLAPFIPFIDGTEQMHKYRSGIIKSDKWTFTKSKDFVRDENYEARAIPNHRLEVAFRINNCFTTKTQPRCNEFRAQVRKLLHPSSRSRADKDVRDYWLELIEVARKVAESEMSDSVDELNLFDAVQMTVLKTMLKVLFKKPFEEKYEGENVDIRRLARDVNEQWLASKSGLATDDEPEWAFEQQGSLRALAEKIVRPWDKTNLENPFNLILPGYETMWRVVLRCIIELMSTKRHPIDNGAWKERLASFIQNPIRSQLQEDRNDKGLTAEHISFEVLRLYPPTRRVARMQAYWGGKRLRTADIEELHHKAPVWRPDPTNFRPERWTTLSEGVDTIGFMPFGQKPFGCLAKEHQSVQVGIPFGVTMIAVLTGCFIEVMAAKWRLNEDNIPSDKPLGNEREDYDTVTLYRVEPIAVNHPTEITGANDVEEAGAVETGAEGEGN